jgi:GNAT superfamily N-acetyltransferase
MIQNTLIRSAQPGDAETIARIHLDSWRATYNKILPPAYLKRMNYGHIVHEVQKAIHDPRTGYLIAEELQGAPMGYICGGPERTGRQIYHSEVYELYITPRHQHQGVGRRLLSALASNLYQRNFYALMVWVLAGNPNRRFYEKTGGLYLGTRTLHFAGLKLKAAAYGWIDMTLLFNPDKT